MTKTAGTPSIRAVIGSSVNPSLMAAMLAKGNLIHHRAGQDNYFGQFFPGIFASHCSNPYLLAPGTNGTAMEVETGITYGRYLAKVIPYRRNCSSETSTDIS